MKYLGTIIWTSLSVIFSIALLEHFYNDYEIVTTSILVVIWWTINQRFTGVNLGAVRTNLFTYTKMVQFKFDRNNSGNEHDGNNEYNVFSEEKIASDEIKEAEKQLRKEEIKFYISSSGNFIIWVWAIIKILGTL